MIIYVEKLIAKLLFNKEVQKSLFYRLHSIFPIFSQRVSQPLAAKQYHIE